MSLEELVFSIETENIGVLFIFAQLLATDALPWHELAEQLGIRLLNEHLNNPIMQESFESILPKDHPKNTRFAINFFTSIGLGAITENLREYFKNMSRLIMKEQKPVSISGESDGSSSESESDSSDSERVDHHRRKRRRRT
ncbi:hypothetical protein HAX54_012879 [Datura stramonium]|uniref:Uncharacterized protein n=1 Tax=Datura stramonium TaxID=4076 RepID=A0ABS8RXQ3_DATST|nr:hypothetical protein [Datura stramonium]